jgi:hypothetical protein
LITSAKGKSSLNQCRHGKRPNKRLSLSKEKSHHDLCLRSGSQT